MRENWHNMLRKKYFCNLLYYFQAMYTLEKELREEKKRDIERQLHMLVEEDMRYEFENANQEKMQQQLINMYKRL